MAMSNPPPCSVADTELLAYRDGELEPARRSLLGQHVAGCPSCQTRLAQADQVSRILTLGSPLREQTAARAVIQNRIAAARDGWWQRRALFGAALPIAVLLIVVIGFNRWLRDDGCASCPPPPASMHVTAVSGVPAGWSALLPCPISPVANQLRIPANQTLVQVAPPVAPGRRGPSPRPARPASQSLPNQVGPSTVAHQHVVTSAPACDTNGRAKRPGLNVGPQLGVSQPFTRRDT